MSCTLAVFPRESPDPRVPADRSPVYRPRKPEVSPLWQLVAHHAHAFLAAYDDRHATRFGPLRAVVPRALESFQRCGIPAHGFARVRCPDCRHEYLLAFSCKQRCLCPSCHAKRQAAFGEFVTEEILPPVPHRHVGISLPRRLRPFFRRRKRLTRLARLAYETIKDLLQAAAATRTAVPGAVACVQSAGNLLDWHPHVHLLVSWGLFRRDGSFIPVEDTPEPETVAQLFRHRVLRLLLEEGAIEERVVRNLLAWPHTGFGTHVSRAIPADATTPGVVARYMARPPITPERMLGETSGPRIIYRSDAVHPRHQANFRVFDPLDFLAEVSAHIPDAHEKTTLFYGWYSNRTRGYRKQRGLLGEAEAETSTGEERASLNIRRSWARLIQQVYEVDPLVCVRCGGTMKIIAVIERPAVIRQIRSAELATKPGPCGAPHRSGEPARAARSARRAGGCPAARVVVRTVL
jgi:hypothetical protein